ncbi:hypothetical protein [Singulisphaera sp. GP187]|uniref:hypothetical protein n=1 Tax=Singulisphaera sp. GP187 TaxID=1882752 RepID=UPI0009416A40|nr:hypothetical protein [Singulisphaera sp. GP187]
MVRKESLSVKNPSEMLTDHRGSILLQGRINELRVLGGAIDPDVEVFGRPRFCVDTQGVAADDEILDPPLVEEFEQILQVFAEGISHGG